MAAITMAVIFAFTAAPAAQADPGYTTPVATITVTVVVNGVTVTVSVSAPAGTFQPGEIIIIIIHSKEQQLGTVRADSAGGFATSVTVPKGFTGAHTIEAIGQTSGITASFPIQLAGGSTTTSGSGSGSGGLSNTGVAVIGIGALGVVLLAGGGMLLLAGKRRKPGEI